jgi:hypothetical protein
MQLETKFLRLRTPVEYGLRFGDWQVCWLGGWARFRLYYLVMLVMVSWVIPPANRRIDLAFGASRAMNGVAMNTCTIDIPPTTSSRLSHRSTKRAPPRFKPPGISALPWNWPSWSRPGLGRDRSPRSNRSRNSIPGRWLWSRSGRPSRFCWRTLRDRRPASRPRRASGMRLQALVESDLTERARERANEIAKDADLRMIAPRDFFSVGGEAVETTGGNR